MHITRIKSCKLDGWSAAEICESEGMGNVIANSYYECNMPVTENKPTANSSMEDRRKFINKKYVQKLWIDKKLNCPLDEYHAAVKEGRKIKVSSKANASKTGLNSETFKPPKVELSRNTSYVFSWCKLISRNNTTHSEPVDLLGGGGFDLLAPETNQAIGSDLGGFPFIKKSNSTQPTSNIPQKNQNTHEIDLLEGFGSSSTKSPNPPFNNSFGSTNLGSAGNSANQLQKGPIIDLSGGFDLTGGQTQQQKTSDFGDLLGGTSNLSTNSANFGTGAQKPAVNKNYDIFGGGFSTQHHGTQGGMNSNQQQADKYSALNANRLGMGFQAGYPQRTNFPQNTSTGQSAGFGLSNNIKF